MTNFSLFFSCFEQCASRQSVEYLVGAAELGIDVHGHAVIALHQRVHEFMEMDRRAFLEALLVHVALDHLLDGEIGSDIEDVGE